MEAVSEPERLAELGTDHFREAFRDLSATDFLNPRRKRVRRLGSWWSNLGDNVAALVAADLELVPSVMKIAEVRCCVFSYVLLSS